MGRWEPNARGRLAQMALQLFAEQGFEQTTAAQIAERAGLTERTFFRHFADKRDPLVYGGEQLEAILVSTIVEAPKSLTPLQLVQLAVETISGYVAENPERTQLRTKVIAAHPELRERELSKLARMTDAVAGALVTRGVDRAAANVAAELGIVVFKQATASWAAEGGDLTASIHSTFEVLSTLTRS